MADIYLTEFEKLKDEQISRSAHRDRLFHLTLVLFGGGITIALTKDAHMLGLLLLLPVVAFIAGTSHITCDRRISSIGSYIKNTLTKRIAEKEQIPSQEVFEWESFIDSDKLRKGRKRTQFMSNIFLYVVSGIGATLWYCYYVTAYGENHRALTTIESCVAGVDFLLMALMAWQLTQHSYIRRSKERAVRSEATTIIIAVLKIAAALVMGGLAAAAVMQFGASLLSAPFQSFDFGFSIPWPVTRLSLAAIGAFVFIGGLVLLVLRRR